MSSFAIVTPVLNDWDNLRELVARLTSQDPLQGHQITLIAVDDGSTHIDAPDIPHPKSPIVEIRILKLKANQGHQRAIALGLAYVERELVVDFTVVMDSDGEDRPEDLSKLIEAHTANEGALIVAERRRRSEGLRFRVFYQIYKMIFSILTGKPISFGNFSLLPSERLSNVLYAAGIWNSFAATMLRSRVPIQFVETDRGERYFGSSTMNFTGLVVHGFSAISVFTDVVIGRILGFLTGASVAVGMIVGTIVFLKLTTSMFVPGYATYMVMFLTIILTGALFGGFLTILSLLSNREQSATLPSNLLEDLTADVLRIERQRQSLSA